MSPACSTRGSSSNCARRRRASASIANLEARRLGIQIAFALMFAVIALIVLLSAAWIGLDFANRLVAPIRRLIGAANVVSTGNLNIQVPVHQLGRRSRPARRDLQQDDARAAHAARRHRARARPDRQPAALHRSGARRAPAPASSVSTPTAASPSSTARPNGCSRRAESEALGRPLAEVAPELAEIFEAARSGNQRLVQRQVTVSRNGQERNFSVRVTSEQSPADRARLRHHHRRHHRARAGAAVLGLGRHRPPHRPRDQEPADADPAVGRTAAPQIRQGDHRRPRRCSSSAPTRSCARSTTSSAWSTSSRASRACRSRSSPPRTSPIPCARSSFLMRVGHPDIDFEVELPEEPMPARFDRRLISQALTNIVKNATEAIGAVPPGRAWRADASPSARARDGTRYRHRRDRQRHRPAEGEPRAPARALRDDAREGHRPRASPSSAAFSKSTAAASSCTTRPRRFRARAARGCSCASSRHEPATAADRAGVGREARQRRSIMASDILIVDDEADIRELVAGILQDEGHGTRTARDSDEALGAIVGAPAEPRLPRHLAAGQPPRRPAAARRAQAGASRSCRS